MKSEIDLLCQSPSVSSPINLDASTVQPVAEQAYRIPPGVLSESLEARRGRNFAGRLVQKLLSEEERRGSSMRGVLGKKALDCHAIIGPGQKCSPRLFLAAKSGPAGQVLVAKSGPPLPKLVLERTMLGTTFSMPKLVQGTYKRGVDLWFLVFS